MAYTEISIPPLKYLFAFAVASLNCRTGKYRGSSQVSIYHPPRPREKLMIS
jgi:hypothetical protein